MILKNGKRIDGCTDTLPVGTVQPFLGLTPPLGYLVCQGQLVSKVEYPELYRICGDAFGPSTSTHFYLPDLRGKTIAGYDSSKESMNSIGKLIGAETHRHLSPLTWVQKNGEYFAGVTNSLGSEWVTGSRDFYGGVTNEMNDSSTGLADNGWTVIAYYTSMEDSYQPTITMNWIVKAAMLIPEYFVVENTLTSTSTSNALSAAQGKILNTSIQTVENRVAAVEQGILVKYVEGFDTTSLNIDGLDIDRDGGVYDIYIYAYHNSDSPSDYFMSINNDTTASYKTIRTFARHSGDTSGQGTAEAPYFNAGLGHWIIGDACNRFMFKGSLMLLQEQTTKVPRLQGTSTVAENTYQSIVNSGGYFNPDGGVNNITSIQIHGVYFKEIRVYICKKKIA